MDAFKPLVAKAAAGPSLTEAEAKAAFELIFAGATTPAQLGGFLMALRARGETVAEITGAVIAMRERMLRVAAPPGAIDIVGTGGDGHGTLNISTLAALITAACGVPVAKHGNRAASSKSGASDVLSALGVGLDLAPREVEACIKEAGLGFMAARTHHLSMRHAAQVRAELGTRTIFNLIGPLANPAGCSASSRKAGSNLSRGSCAISARRQFGSCMGPTASTRRRQPAPPSSPRLKTAKSAPFKSRPRMPDLPAHHSRSSPETVRPPMRRRFAAC